VATATSDQPQPVGTFCLVLHSHLPWVAHHGSWPVGEEWLHQAWSATYLPIVNVLSRLATEGARDLLTLGVSPTLTAQLDDAYCLRRFHAWLGLWQTRTAELADRARRRGDEATAALAAREFRSAATALEAFETRWRHGGSGVLRPLVDSGAVELLGGPAAHPFLPLLAPRTTAFAVSTGLDDTALRVGHRPSGLWSPECGYRPGLEQTFAAAGITHLIVDEETARAAGRSPTAGWDVHGSGVVAFARDLAITNLIWSSRSGYPTGGDYRDFHHQDDLGFRPARVTSLDTAADRKAPYDPDRAAAAVERDARDFVSAVRRHLIAVSERARPGAPPPLVVAAYDTELFGHWWHEGPAFLDRILRLLPQAGVRLRTLRGALDDGLVGGRVDLGPGSWGAGKDYRVWAGEQVGDFTARQADVEQRLLSTVDLQMPSRGRATALDQLAREALLCLSSDWAFMVTRDSAADYARDRSVQHAGRFSRLADAIDAHGPQDSGVRRMAEQLRTVDGPFPALDARLLANDGSF
jgi:1,4-alpha-glucan branching enzyme